MCRESVRINIKSKLFSINNNSYDFADFLIRLLEKKENINIVEKYRDDVSKLKILKKY